LLTEQDGQDAIATAIGFFAGSREPFALLWLDVMHRRFGIPQFADALQRFDRVLAERPAELPLLRVFRRMADRDNPLRLEDMDAVTHPSDRLVVDERGGATALVLRQGGRVVQAPRVADAR
jgi:hypothetical protein